MNGSPDKQFLYSFIVMPKNIARAGDGGPLNTGMSFFQHRRQAFRRFRNNLKTTCYPVKHKQIVAKGFVGETFNETVGEADVVANVN